MEEMLRVTVLDDRSGNAETLLLSFVAVLHVCRTENGAATEIRHRYAGVLEICITGPSNKVKCMEYNSKLYSLRGRQPV